MVKKTFHFSWKIFLEIIFGLFLVWLACAIALAAVLKNKPLDLQSAIPVIEGKINQQLVDNSVAIGGLVMEWRGIHNPIGLIAQQVSISNDRGAFLHSSEIDIDLSTSALIIGRVLIKNLRINRIIISLTRTIDGQLQITGHNQERKPKNENAVPALLTLNSLIYDLPNLQSLSINDAQIIYVDEVENTLQHFDPVTIFAAMEDIDGDRQLGGYVSLPFGDTYAANIVRLNFKTQPSPLALNVQASIEGTPVDSFLQFAPAQPNGFDMNMVVNADIRAQFDNLWNVAAFDLALNAPRGQIIAEYGGEEKLFEVSDLSTQISRHVDTNRIQVNALDMTLDNIADISFAGEFDAIETPSKLAGAFKLNVSKMPQSMLAEYWPSNAQDNGAYNWLVSRMSIGNFKDIALEMHFNRAWSARADDIDLPPWLKSVQATYAFEDMAVDYRAPLTPSSKTNGTGAYDGQSIDLKIDTAKIGDMDVKNATLVLPLGHTDTSIAPLADLNFPITGDVASVFDYIEKDPINVLDKIGFDTKSAKGSADLNVALKFPLIQDLQAEDIDVDVTGTLNDVTIKNIVKNLTLSGGPFAIKTGTKQIELKGTGFLSGMPLDLDYQEYFQRPTDAQFKRRVDVKTTANASIQRAFLGDFADYIDGNARVDLAYKTNPNGVNTAIDLSLNLVDASVVIDAVGLQKPKGEALNATMQVNLKNDTLQSIRNLKLDGKSISVKDADITMGVHDGAVVLKSASFKNIKLGNNILSVEAVDNNSVLDLNITGQYLDARPILVGKKQEQAKAQKKATHQPLNITINVDEVRTADKASLKDNRIKFISNRAGKVDRFELDAKAGAGNLYVRYNPEDLDENGLSLRVESDNAGDTLRAFSLYPNIYGGTLRIAGKPLDGGSLGDVRGMARIDDFKALDTPILVRLLNALSFKEPSNSLNFTRLESNFEWRLGNNGDIYRIENGTTAGASIGLTFDGIVDTGKGTMDIKGTAALLSQLNNFVSSIPIIGDILTGGGGALLAATYSIRGNTDDPWVSVNPLSVLTPGIVRKLLFEGGTVKAPEPTAGIGNDEGKGRAPLN